MVLLVGLELSNSHYFSYLKKADILKKLRELGRMCCSQMNRDHAFNIFSDEILCKSFSEKPVSECLPASLFSWENEGLKYLLDIEKNFKLSK